MPLLNLTDVLFDPDFCDRTLRCIRTTITVNDQGVGVKSQEQLPFSGVVTSDRGDVLARGAVGEHIYGNILVVTKFALRDGGTGYTADIVAWGGKQYTVTSVNDYTTYGQGFVEATCELIPLAG